jgi:hypothetical protein
MVVPLSRPSDLGNVLHNFWRQKHPEKRLCIIENGLAIGVCARHGIEPNLLLAADSGPAEALNVALAELLRRGEHAAWWCKIDGDDYYGPGYLDEIAQAPAEADLIGKSRVWIKTVGGRLWLFPFDVPAGGTLATRVAQAVDFDPNRCVGSDVQWVSRMLEAGARFWSSSERYYCFRRWGWPHSHTCRRSDSEMLRAAWDAEVFDAGPYDETVIDGVRGAPLKLLVDGQTRAGDGAAVGGPAVAVGGIC